MKRTSFWLVEHIRTLFEDRYAARRRVAGGGHAVVDIACAATCNYNKNVTRNRRNSSQIKCEKVEINLSTKAWQATIVN